jgi:hypothetical protein
MGTSLASGKLAPLLLPFSRGRDTLYRVASPALLQPVTHNSLNHSPRFTTHPLGTTVPLQLPTSSHVSTLHLYFSMSVATRCPVLLFDPLLLCCCSFSASGTAPADDLALMEIRCWLCCSCRSCNYQRFMALYATAPRMSPYLMDLWLPRIRAATLKVLLVAYRPTALPMDFVASCLGFEGVQEVRRCS